MSDISDDNSSQEAFAITPSTTLGDGHDTCSICYEMCVPTSGTSTEAHIPAALTHRSLFVYSGAADIHTPQGQKQP
jgi:hypothetical protein